MPLRVRVSDALPWLRSVANDHGISLTELAKRSGVAPSTLWRATTTTGQWIKTATLEKIAAAMQVPAPTNLKAGPAHGLEHGIAELSVDLIRLADPQNKLSAATFTKLQREYIATIKLYFSTGKIDLMERRRKS